METSSRTRPKRSAKRPARYSAIEESDRPSPSRPRKTSKGARDQTQGHDEAAAEPTRRRPKPSTRAIAADVEPVEPSGSGQGDKRPQRKKPKKTAKSSRPKKVGKRNAFTDDELQALRENAQAREERRNDLIDGLSEQQCKEYLKKLAGEQPGIILDIMEMYAEEPDRDQPDVPVPPVQQPNWCTCGNCRMMHLAIEEVCCRQQPDNCLSRTPEMHHLCLDAHVLHLSMLFRADILAITNIAQDDVREKNRSFRYSGYRQHTLWQHGRLGRGVRRVIPSCCIWRIRDTYPDPAGQYVPYAPGI